MSLGRARYLAGVVVVGLVGAAFAIAFRAALAGVLRLAFHRGDILSAFRALPVAARVLVPAIGGLVAGLLGTLAARRAGGHGMSEILEAVALGRGQPSLPTALLTGAGSFAAIAAGGSIGREGPIVQFGSGVGALVGRRLGLGAAEIRTLVAAGTAAGFAAAYDAPIGAVLFVVEIVTGLMALEVVLPCLVAAAISTALARLTLGEAPIYGLRSFRVVSPGELPVYALLAVLAGLLGPLFLATLDRGERLARRAALPRPARGAVGGLLVGLLAAGLPEVSGNGYEAIALMLDGRVPGAMLGVLLAAKLLATVISVSSGMPGGVFTPSLFLGAALGGSVAAAARAIAPAALGPALPASSALVGMACLAAATTHAPLMASALLLEFTGDLSLLPPLLAGTAIATAVARRLRPSSIYTEELERRGIPWTGNLTERLARAVHARDIVQRDPPVVDPGAPIDDALRLLEQGRTRAVYVLPADGGSVRAIDLHAAKTLWARRARGEPPDGARAGDLARAVPVASPDDSLPELSEKLWQVDWGEIPVVAPGSPPRLVGIVTRRDLLAAFDREVLQRDVLVTRVVWFEGQRESADYLELPPGQRVELVRPPPALVGRGIDVGELHRRFGVTVLGVRADGSDAGPALVEPSPDRPVRAADRLLLKGSPAAIAAFTAW
ncbi:MAG: chloride channel protein [Myxococcales bacterium]|nr:chloride channel protein [Myxococcales bacterium]